MELIKIFLLGGATGIFFSIISMILISASNSEIYPIGGFMPALWMISDLGISSQIIVAGILIMGGMTGFYLTLTFWKDHSFLQMNKGKKETDSYHSIKKENNDIDTITTVKGKSLSEFL